MGKALFIAYGDVVESAVQLLNTIDHEADIVEDLSRGWERAAQGGADVVALAVKVGGRDGLALLPKLKQLPHSPEVVVLAAVADPKAAEFALRNGAWDVLQVQAGP